MGIPIRLNLDTTGASVDNRITNEPHTLQTSTNARIVVPSYGAFYSDSLVITDIATGLPLRTDQFYPSELYEVPTAKYGKEVYALIVITDVSVSNNISLTYQALGGDYNASLDAIEQLIANLQLDARPVNFSDILHKPSEYPPSMHLHDVGDVYGFEYLVHSINRLRMAIEAGDSVTARNIYKYINDKYAVIDSQLTLAFQSLSNRVLVGNKATNSIAEAAADDTLWMTPLTTKKLVEAVLSENKNTDYDFLAYYESI